MSKKTYFDLAQEAHKREAYAEALALLRRASCYGLINRYSAMAWLAYYHEMGLGTRRDPYTATLWYEASLRMCCKSARDGWAGQRLRNLQEQNPEPLRAPTTIVDPYIGRVEIAPSTDANKLAPRFYDHYIKALYYHKSPYDNAIVSVWETLNERDKRRKDDHLPEIIDENFCRDYDHFQLRIARNRTDSYDYTRSGECYTLLLPRSADCRHKLTREAIIRHSMRLMDDAALRYLTQRTAAISASSGLKYSKVEIRRAINPLGQFIIPSRRVEYSMHAIKYPHIYIDSLIYHELCHSVRCDHSSAFYDAVKQYGGEAIYRADQRIFDNNNISTTI